MIVILLLVSTLAFIYYYAIKPYQFWAQKNVQTGKITRVFGDSLPIFLGMESMPDMIQRVYNKFGHVRYFGTYRFSSPVLIVKCPNLIKQICVKDFDHFLDHKQELPDGIEDLWSRNLIALRGQTWKNMRSTMSPSFTSSKMKAMFVLVCHNANLFVKHFLKMDKKVAEIELKDAITRYTNDVIASTAFGIEVDSLGERENKFYVMGAEASNFSTFWKTIVYCIYLLGPSIGGFFQLSFFGRNVKEFFLNLVKDTIKMREEKNIRRPDMLQLLMEARKGKQVEKTVDEMEDTSFAVVQEHLEMKTTRQTISDDDIASQVFVFFLAGFETASSTMCFMAYELAVNPDVQKRLIDEIDENRASDGSAPSYDTIMSMTYMDMVLSETLRKWPPAVETDRLVTKPYTIEPELPHEKTLHLDVGDDVIVPIFAIQRDPKYYADPEKFDPERFSPENRKSINPYTYLPFGIGPRNCIASRFALLEIKAIFFYLLSTFEIVPVEKTQIPVKVSKSSYHLASEDGFIFGLKRRE